jgi:hypothetical protein
MKNANAKAEFGQRCQTHRKHLKLKGLQPKTIDAYARAIRRMGDYFDHQIDALSPAQLTDYFSDLIAVRLPSDSQSPAKPLPLANASPRRVGRGLSPPNKCALPGAPKKVPPSLRSGGQILGEFFVIRWRCLSAVSGFAV